MSDCPEIWCEFSHKKVVQKAHGQLYLTEGHKLIYTSNFHIYYTVRLKFGIVDFQIIPLKFYEFYGSIWAIFYTVCS